MLPSTCTVMQKHVISLVVKNLHYLFNSYHRRGNGKHQSQVNKKLLRYQNYEFTFLLKEFSFELCTNSVKEL